MKKRTLQRTMALAASLLFVVVWVGGLSGHLHPAATDQSCTLCHALHFGVSPAPVPTSANPVLLASPAISPPAGERTFLELTPSVTYRGPPLRSSIS